jgi:hypothetical protein
MRKSAICRCKPGLKYGLIALAASKAAGYMSLQRPLDAEIVITQKEDNRENVEIGMAKGYRRP